jgi:hypothetical protein
MENGLLAPRLQQTVRWLTWRPRHGHRLCHRQVCVEFQQRDRLSLLCSQTQQETSLEGESDPERSFPLPVDAVYLIAERVKAALLIVSLIITWQCISPGSSWALTIGWRARRHHRRMGEKDRDLHTRLVRFCTSVSFSIYENFNRVLFFQKVCALSGLCPQAAEQRGNISSQP